MFKVAIIHTTSRSYEGMELSPPLEFYHYLVMLSWSYNTMSKL